MPVQIVFASAHTSASYVIEHGWQKASIPVCPICGKKVARHGTYVRKQPEGVRIARCYCRRCKMTLSLLPAFLAAGFSDTLNVHFDAVRAASTYPTFDSAALALRPDIEIQGARRWLRRRVRRHALTLLLVSTMLGAPSASIQAPLLRAEHPCALASLPTPIGLCHRHLSEWGTPKPEQHKAGPDPP